MTLTLFENTYVTLQEASDYFNNRPDCDIWNTLSDSKKEKALIFATLKINNLNFVGNKKSPSQALEFPRDFSPELPCEIKYAVCEEALAIYQENPNLLNKKLGISSISLGSSSVSYFSEENCFGLLSPDAFSFISKWLQKHFYMR